MTRKSNHYLKRRRERGHYYRRVPKKYEAIDPRGTIRIALDTDCLTIAREKRNRLAAADEALWQSSLMSLNGQGDEICALKQRHKFAQNRALALGFTFKPIDQLIGSDNLRAVFSHPFSLSALNWAQMMTTRLRRPSATADKILSTKLGNASLLARSLASQHYVSVPGGDLA